MRGGSWKSKPGFLRGAARLRDAIGERVSYYHVEAAGQDVLLFIDNIFRFILAGAEVSVLLGRMSSAEVNAARAEMALARALNRLRVGEL